LKPLFINIETINDIAEKKRKKRSEFHRADKRSNSFGLRTATGPAGDYLTRPGKKFVTPNQDVLVTRLFCKSMRKCCAEEYAESWVNIHHIYRNIQIITSLSASKDCMGRPGLNLNYTTKLNIFLSYLNYR
jgi:hypothetical protein